VQIRIANRQDEPEIRTFVDTIYQKSGSSLNIERQDSDLRNMEANYFGKEGLFIVAEDNDKIVGLAGARKKSERVLEFKRLMVSADVQEADEILSEMIDVIVRFAPRMLFEQIEVTENKTDRLVHLLSAKGFASAGHNNEALLISITPDF
jgi:N-acetylglutamate synthase-like GNAT family acetyltransferase